MRKYQIEIKETLSRLIEIESESIKDAFRKVENDYKSEEIVLDYNDFVEVSFLEIRKHKN